MQWLRTISCFVRVLVALFVMAQLAGVVASPLASAQVKPAVGSAHTHHHHAHHHLADQHSGEAIYDSHDSNSTNHQPDPCCALHAFFTGVLPAVIAVNLVDLPHGRLSVDLPDMFVGIDPGRLDRPPRPFVAT
jgi:hypothetical protein